MSKIYVVSRFLGQFNGVNRFHFIGYFKGKRIEKIEVLGGDFEKGADYVLAVKRPKLLGNKMQSVLVKAKRII